MFILGNFFIALSSVVHVVMQLAWFVLLVRIIASWVRPSPPAGLVRDALSTVYAMTDPVLDWLRNRLGFLQVGAIDLSPIVLFLAIGFLDDFLTRSLWQLGAALA